MRKRGEETLEEVRVYFIGGATAIFFGWREATIDIDLRFEPDSDRILRAIPRLKAGAS